MRNWTPVETGRLAGGGYIAAAWLTENSHLVSVAEPAWKYGHRGVNARAPSEAAAIAECERRMVHAG